MNAVDTFSMDHQLLTLFALVLVKQLGAPLPGWPILMLAGAMGAMAPVFGAEAFVAATVASVLADFAWFEAGKRFGRRILALVCRVSISPDNCVSRNEESFARRGPSTLLIAKFVPGLGTIAPALAGSLGLRGRDFGIFTVLGSALWAGGGMAVGWVFQRQVHELLAWTWRLGRLAGAILLVMLALYVVRRGWKRWTASRRGITTSDAA